MEDSGGIASLPQVLIPLWHDHRILVLFFAVVVILAALTLDPRKRREKSSSQTPGSPKIDVLSHGQAASPKHADRHDNRIILEPDRSLLSTTAPTLSKEPLAATKPVPKRLIGSKVTRKSKQPARIPRNVQPWIFYSSLTGTSEKHASVLAQSLQVSLKDQPRILPPQIHNLSSIDYDDFFVTLPQSAPATEPVNHFYLLLVPSYNIDTVLSTFLSHLKETYYDFRIDSAPLSGLAGYSVFGFGDREGWPTEEEGFCSQAREVDVWMAKLTSRKRAFPIGMGDVKSDVNDRLAEWTDGVSKVLLDINNKGGLGEGVPGSGDALESDDEDIVDEASEAVDPQRTKRKRRPRTKVDDLEDIRGQSPPLDNVPLPVDFTTNKSSRPVAPEPKEMVPATSPTYAALTKQGYTIIGSHSGVKICRWTKSALRGRGSCYKYSFYGIKSHLCMETTPSLSCSNKCVFCWRHGTNPVGTTWRWKVDPPDLIFQGAKEGHLKKIKMMRGVPGVRAERFQEAMRIRHCALSLVGEPIFYPHINEFLQLLHAERISSFLVCNAQHPEQLQALDHVTQLYVSIDASNKESLRKVDRPLHRDFWERFLSCLDILREKRFQMRTVFRLTLVKGFNVDDEAEGYADLVARGLPCFVEIKGVTYCGTSSSAGAGLTMQNVPFYDEVVAFVEAFHGALGRRGLGYGIAAEHAHSCCILIASDRFLIEGKWHTLIDYEKFFTCLESGEEFAPEDYVGPPTPEWAAFGNGGFNPADERVHKKGKHKSQIVDTEG
ncbi:MAG: hypothetical protein LQ348_004892 [Seirophora lacunosa]|nr:MAG: hypothetical protein LQ344_000665 [Seirophora lacunosa]KAI4182162.1 MAG: hypothetical protein LQ348_004892 [Seirophora lacunosa]